MSIIEDEPVVCKLIAYWSDILVSSKKRSQESFHSIEHTVYTWIAAVII